MDSPSGLISLRTAAKILSSVGNGSLAETVEGNDVNTVEPKNVEAIATVAVAFFNVRFKEVDDEDIQDVLLNISPLS